MITVWAVRKFEWWESEKTGKAAWRVFLINVWLQPSCLPAPPAPLASVGWLLCPHLAPQMHMVANVLPRDAHSPAGIGSTALPSCIISGRGSASSLPSVGLKLPALPFQVTFPQELLSSFVGNSSARPSAAKCWCVCVGSALRQCGQEASTCSGNKTAGILIVIIVLMMR